MDSFMPLAKSNSSFTANLYVDGLPVVLNQQRLNQRLLSPRITKREKLDAEVGLVDKRERSFITLADHEDDNPLLLKFTPQGKNYAISVVLEGVDNGARFAIENKTHNLLVSVSDQTAYFSIDKVGVTDVSLAELEPGPAYIELQSELSNRPLYRQWSDGMSTFLDVDPNVTKHNAFNQKPVIFVIKIVEKLPVIS